MNVKRATENKEQKPIASWASRWLQINAPFSQVECMQNGKII